ncbi:MAG: peptidylprolyl isomerase [Prevotella sp.]|nr:peptidylprolyl isomerase [Bacteroidales bacterium]MDY3841586.1 peptidylprolyl isomerase [Prevotella sp.]
MKTFCYLMWMLMLPLSGMAQTDTLRHEVLVETNMGNIRMALFNETPVHRDNFIKMVKEGYYDGILFHRVINRFMIQTGDSTTRHALPGDSVGEYSPPYTLQPEILFPRYYHKRGVVAAAREPDNVNPNRESSPAHFYIVYGRRYTDEGLDKVQERITKATDGKVTLPPEVRQWYKDHGGTPHLDGQYTVFGEVLEGMDVVDRIQTVETDKRDRPLQDVRIIRATVIK